jgi:hypothetical protein
LKRKEELTDADILRRNAERQLKKKQARSGQASSDSEILKLNHELAVHQIIIVETADTYSELVERLPRDSVNDFFFKPYNRGFLIKLIKKHFSKQSI